MNVAAARAALGVRLPAAPPPVAPTMAPVAAATESTPKAAMGNGAAVVVTAAAPAPSNTVDMPDGWTDYAASLASAIAVPALQDSIKKGGHRPKPIDDGDVRLFERAIQKGLTLKFGNAPVPWWLGCGLALGGMYASMRIGAEAISKEERQQLGAPAHAAATPAATSTAGDDLQLPPAAPPVAPTTGGV